MEGLDRVTDFKGRSDHFDILNCCLYLTWHTMVPGISNAFCWVRKLAIVNSLILNTYDIILYLGPNFYFFLFLFLSFAYIRERSVFLQVQINVGSRCSKCRKLLDMASYIYHQLHNSRELCCSVIEVCANHGYSQSLLHAKTMRRI